jgi:hypothetical protein
VFLLFLYKKWLSGVIRKRHEPSGRPNTDLPLSDETIQKRSQVLLFSLKLHVEPSCFLSDPIPILFLFVFLSLANELTSSKECCVDHVADQMGFETKACTETKMALNNHEMKLSENEF